MSELKFPKLPDRTPVKVSITITPDLAAALSAYASAYHEAYGREEPVADLIPAMLACFLESDRAFVRGRAKIVTGIIHDEHGDSSDGLR